MSANATDLRLIHAEQLGPTVSVALSNVNARSDVLPPGRYVARVRTVAGVTTAWFRQGGAAVVATATVPSTPFLVSGTTLTAESVRLLNGVLFSFIVRGDSDDESNHLAGVLNAGTCTLDITRISRK